MLHFTAVPPPVATLLEILSGHPALRDFALGGGTSLALRFGHRLSVDLDYFTGQEFETEKLVADLGLPHATVTGSAKNSLTLDVSGVKVDLIRHGYQSLASPELLSGINLVSLPDLAAMKLNAVANRGSKKDFYDLARLLDQFSLEDMLGFFSEKYRATDSFTVTRSLAWFENAETEPDPLCLTGLTWPQIKSRITSEVARL